MHAGLSGGFLFGTPEVATSRFSSQFSTYRSPFHRSAGQPRKETTNQCNADK